MSIRITAEREIEDPRLDCALQNPIRRRYCDRGIDPIDPLIESTLGRLLLDKKITIAEYNTGSRWRKIYDNWLLCIEAPPHLTEEAAQAFEGKYKMGAAMLHGLGRRVFDSVNAVCVYDQPEELGDFAFTTEAARRGLHALAGFLLDDQDAYEVIPSGFVEAGRLLEAPRKSSVTLHGKSRSAAARQLLPELRTAESRTVMVDCQELDNGKIEIRKYNSWDVRF